MPRKKPAAKATAKELATPPAKGNPQRGEEGYDPLKDPWNVGFQLGDASGTWIANKLGKKPGELDAYDFYADPATGRRPGEASEPSHGSYIDLEDTGVNEKTTLPPMNVWKEGQYLFDLIDDKEFLEQFDELPYRVKDELRKATKEDLSSTSPPARIFGMYVVEGEGTPGNFVWRVYDLPRSVAGDAHPKHPLMWNQADKRGKQSTKSYWSPGYSSYSSPSPSPSTPTKPAASTMPAGVRIRCSCGHWFRQPDLPGHATVCPAMEATGEADWAMMCAEECGCRTLDEASRCKPGFPREKMSPDTNAGDDTEPSGNGAVTKPQKQLAAT